MDSDLYVNYVLIKLIVQGIITDILKNMNKFSKITEVTAFFLMGYGMPRQKATLCQRIKL